MATENKQSKCSSSPKSIHFNSPITGMLNTSEKMNYIPHDAKTNESITLVNTGGSKPHTPTFDVNSSTATAINQSNVAKKCFQCHLYWQ